MNWPAIKKTLEKVFKMFSRVINFEKRQIAEKARKRPKKFADQTPTWTRWTDQIGRKRPKMATLISNSGNRVT